MKTRLTVCLLFTLIPFSLTICALLAAPPLMWPLSAAIAAAMSPIAAAIITRVIADPIISSPTNLSALYDELAPLTQALDKERGEALSRQTEAETRAKQIELIMSRMKEALVMTNHEGKTILANQAAVTLFDEELVNRHLLHVCRDINLSRAMKTAEGGSPSETSLERGGRSLRVFISPVAAEEADRLNGALLLFLDVSESVRAERSRKEFSANVSHELKTPLTTIAALAEMLSTGMAKPEDAPAFAQKIQTQATRLISLIEDVIRLSRFDEGRVSGGQTPVSPLEAAKQTAAALSEKAAAKNVSVSITGDPHKIPANEGLLDELLYNLIDNGIKYNKQDGALTVAVAFSPSSCEIRVSDTGVGVPPQDLPHVFERFYRADKSRARQTPEGGTGLGLAIVKHIAEYHKGRVSITSELDKGTTVTVSLPS